MHALCDDVFAYAIRPDSSWTARLGTRSLDTIRVAAAIALRGDSFRVFDDRRRKLAKAAKLRVA